MDTTNSITIPEERKRGAHLCAEERGSIQRLHKLCYSNRAIAQEINCSPSTVGYELKRGTALYSGRGRKPGYWARRGMAIYKSNRSRCGRPKTVPRASAFLLWMVARVRLHKWSFDVCVGHALLNDLFPVETIPCTKTLYNLLWQGELPLTLFELPEVLSRRIRGKPNIPKRFNGKSIDECPVEVAQRTTFDALGTKIYFAHPYSAWERPINERTNRILRKFIPKGTSISRFTDEQIPIFADEINATPRKHLDYHTPEALFEAELDIIYKIVA